MAAPHGPAPDAPPPSLHHTAPGSVPAGIGLRVLAMMLMAVLNALVKHCGAQGIPVLEIVFFRNAFAFIPLFVFIFRGAGLGVLATRRPLGHLTRAAVGLTSMAAGFAAVQHLPLSEATAFGFASPLFMTLLAGLMLGETIGPRRAAAVVAGFCGMLVMVRPDGTVQDVTGTALAILAAICAAGAMVTIREISRTERGPTIVFYFTLAGTVLGAASLPFHWVTPDRTTLLLLVAAGLVGGTLQIALTEALRRAPVAVLAPFDYTQLIWASLIGYALWGEMPRLRTLAGVGIIAAAGLYILQDELRRNRQVPGTAPRTP